MIGRLVSARTKCPPQAVESFQADVVAGLSAWPKHLSCKYFYDRRGSKLFDAICDLDEYYLTRCELEVMHRDAPQMAQAIGACDMLIEYGSGSSIKTRLLLDHLQPAAYVPVDISEKHLFATARRLARRYPHIEILPAAADFTDELGVAPHRARAGAANRVLSRFDHRQPRAGRCNGVSHANGGNGRGRGRRAHRHRSAKGCSHDRGGLQ